MGEFGVDIRVTGLATFGLSNAVLGMKGKGDSWFLECRYTRCLRELRRDMWLGETEEFYRLEKMFSLSKNRETLR